MKKLAVLLIMLLVPSVLHAAASSETGDTRAEPISLYGKQSDGTVTALQVDSDGKLVISGGGSGDSVWTAGDTTVSLDTTNSGKTVVMDADATVASDMTIGNNLSVGNTISAGSVSVGSGSSVSLHGDGITLQIDGDVTGSGILSISDTIYVVNGEIVIGNKAIKGDETIILAQLNPTELTKYPLLIPAEYAPNGFTVTDFIVSRDITQSGNLSASAYVGTFTNSGFVADSTIETVTFSVNDFKVEDDGTIDNAAIAGDKILAFDFGLDTTSKVNWIINGYKNKE